jgi:hypothetical protein
VDGEALPRPSSHRIASVPLSDYPTWSPPLSIPGARDGVDGRSTPATPVDPPRAG